MATYLTHFKAARTWIERSWDDLDAAHPLVSKKVDTDAPPRTPAAPRRVVAPTASGTPTPLPRPSAKPTTEGAPIETSPPQSPASAKPTAEASPVEPPRAPQAAPTPTPKPGVVATPAPAITPPATPRTESPQRRTSKVAWAASLLAVASASAWMLTRETPTSNGGAAAEAAARDRDALVARTLELEAATRRSATDRDLARTERDDAVATAAGSRREADALKRSLVVSEGRRLLVDARRRAKDDPTLGLLVAIEGADRAPGPFADAVVAESVLMLRERASLVAGVVGSPAAAWRPDQRAVVASGPGGGLLWTPDGDAWKRTDLPGPTDGFAAVTFSADGSRFAACGADGFARVFSADGTVLRTITDISCDVLSVALDAEGALLAIGAADGVVRVHDTASGKLLRTLEMMDPVDGVAFDRRGLHLAVMTRGDHRTRFFAVASGRPEGSIPGELVGAEQGFSPEGDRVLVRSANGALVWARWYGTEGAATEPLLGGLAMTTGAVSPDGGRLACVGTDRVIRIVDAETRTVRASFAGPAVPPSGIAWTPDGLGILLTGRDGVARHWALRPVLDTGPLVPPSGLVHLGTHPDPVGVAISGNRVTLVPWAVSGNPLGFEIDGAADAVSLSADGRCLVTADRDGVAWRDARDGRTATRVPVDGTVVRLAVSADARRVVAATADGRLVISVDRGAFTDAGWDGPVSALSIDPDGREAIVAGKNRSAVVIDLDQRRRSATLAGTARGATAVACRAGVKATGTSDGIVSLHDAGGRARTILDAGREVASLAIAPDGASLAVTTIAGNFYLVDTVTGERRIDVATGTTGPIASFLADGGAVLLGTDGTRLAVPADPTTEGRARRPRLLTLAERARLGIPADVR